MKRLEALVFAPTVLKKCPHTKSRSDSMSGHKNEIIAFALTPKMLPNSMAYYSQSLPSFEICFLAFGGMSLRTKMYQLLCYVAGHSW